MPIAGWQEHEHMENKKQHFVTSTKINLSTVKQQ
jgi:hypothetical protein